MILFHDLVFVKPHPFRVPVGVERRVVTPRVCPGWRRRVAKRPKNAKNMRIPSKIPTWPHSDTPGSETRGPPILVSSDAETTLRMIPPGTNPTKSTHTAYRTEKTTF